MSSNTSTSFSTSSFTSSSNGQTTGSSHTQHSHTDDRGTTIRTTSQNLGEPAQEETKRYDTQGRELISGDETNVKGRIEDVTDADRLYEERIEDEYAKREGGA